MSCEKSIASTAVHAVTKGEIVTVTKFMPLGMLCETSEVASVICFLLSDDASYVTASDIPVDGGYMSMSPEGFGEK